MGPGGGLGEADEGVPGPWGREEGWGRQGKGSQDQGADNPCVNLIKDDDNPCVKLIKDDDIPCVKLIKDDDNP